jgi:hypothetical protein
VYSGEFRSGLARFDEMSRKPSKVRGRDVDLEVCRKVWNTRDVNLGVLPLWKPQDLMRPIPGFASWHTDENNPPIQRSSFSQRCALVKK